MLGCPTEPPKANAPRRRMIPQGASLGFVYLVVVATPVVTHAQREEPVAMTPAVLKTESYRHYVDAFNEHDEELYANIPNAKAWEFLAANVPLMACPDKDIERTYYFRWWTYRKHVKKTPDGYVITEFLPKVPWSGKHNTISSTRADGSATGGTCATTRCSGSARAASRGGTVSGRPTRCGPTTSCGETRCW